MDGLKGELEEVDTLKKSIRELEDKSSSAKMRSGFIGKKLVDCKGILEQTKSSLDNFVHETKTIVCKAKLNVDKQNVHKGAFDTYNEGIQEIVKENGELEETLAEKRKELEDLKLKCKNQIQELQAMNVK